MTARVRRGGRGTLADGARLTWSVAGGRQGRRWRSNVVEDGRMRSALLLETDVRGRPIRLEVATAGGLMTLHPGHDERALHGNVVTPDGIRHLAFDWSPRHEVLVEGEPLVAIAAVARLATALPAGRNQDVLVVLVRRSLEVDAVSWRFEHSADGHWRLGAGAGAVEVAVDADGLPDGLTDAVAWPLEE